MSDKPINSVYHGKWQYLVILVVVVIVIELSSGHKILRVEAMIDLEKPFLKACL